MVKSSKPHVVLLASPGLGHLIPIIELGKRLIAQHGFTITVFAVTTDSRQIEEDLLQSYDGHNFNIVALLPNVADISQERDPNIGILTRMLGMVRSTLPTLRSTINDMKVKPTAIIVDQFGTEAVKVVGEEFNMLKYVFVVSNAWFLAYNLYMPYVKENVDPNKPFYIPGCDPIPGGDLLQHTFDPDSKTYRDFVDIGRDISRVDSGLVNTWKGLERRTLEAFMDDLSMKSIIKVPVYAVGPVIRRPKKVLEKKSELIKWLDAQPEESVLYISFGSGGTISTQQTTELAWGLELSKHRFIWVIRPPSEKDTAGFLFKSVNNNSDEWISKCLPDRFMDRTRDHGIVVSKWVSQEVILQHRSVGGFISHCGWNSILESIVNGVPIIAWPLYAEQNMNATTLAKSIGIAVRSKVKPSEAIIRREEIETMVKCVMDEDNDEGIKIRSRVKDLKMSTTEALNKGGKGGSSYCALSKVAKDIVHQSY